MYKYYKIIFASIFGMVFCSSFVNCKELVNKGFFDQLMDQNLVNELNSNCEQTNILQIHGKIDFNNILPGFIEIDCPIVLKWFQIRTGRAIGGEPEQNGYEGIGIRLGREYGSIFEGIH